jgi:hypothetical protein
MADPKIGTRVRTRGLRGGARGEVDRRPLLLIAIGTLAAIVLVAMVWRLDRTAETTTRRRLVDLDRIVVPASPTDEELQTPATDIDRDTIASLREGASVQVADEQGRLAQEYGAARIDPLPDEWIAMTTPWARFHPENGRLVEMTARDGTLRVPERAIESGRLEGDVRIRIFEADVATRQGDERVPSVEIEAEVAEYDAASGRLDSPGRIRVRTAEAFFEGEDLRVIFGPDGATIERLTVERALGPIEIRRLPAMASTGTAGRTASSARKDPAPPRPTRRPDVSPSPAGSAVASSSSPTAEDAWRARGDAPPPAAEVPPSPVNPEDVYRVVLDRDVIIERTSIDAGGVESKSRIEGDRMTLVLSLASGGMDDTFASNVGPTPTMIIGPKDDRRSVPVVAPSRAAMVAAVAMTSVSQVADATGDPDIVRVHFAGRLVMTPAPDQAALLADADDAHLVVDGVDGRGITLRDDRQQAEGEAARLEYRVASSRVDLIGDDAHPLSLRSPRFTLAGGRFWMDRSTNVGGLVGPGSMTFDADGAAAVQAAWHVGEDGIRRAVAEGVISDPILVAFASAVQAHVDDDEPAADPDAPPQLEIVWEGGVDLDFQDGASDARLKQARFRGDVRVEGDEFRLGSQNLVVDFAESGANDDIERILATGNARVDRVGEVGSLEASAIDLGLTRTDDGRTIPRELIAQGGVAASDPSQTLWTDRLVVRFRPAPVAPDGRPGTDPPAAGRGLAGGLAPEASVGEVEIHTVLATDGVQVRLDEGARVFADRLDGDASAGTLELQGSDVMIVRGNVVADRMREIRLDESNRSVRSPGPGRFRYFEQIVVPDETTRIDRPQPPTRTSLAATWKEAMAYRQEPDGTRGRLDLDGDVRVRSTPDERTSDRLDARSVSLDLVHGAGGVRADRRDGDLLANRGDTTVERLVARGDAVLESREWKDAAKTGDPKLFRVTGNLVDYRVDTGEATVEGEGGLLVHEPEPSPRRRADAPIEAGFGVDGTTRFRWKRGMTMTREAEGRYLVVMDEDVEVLHAGLGIEDQMTLTGRRLEVVVDRVQPMPDAKPVRRSEGIELGGPAEILRVRGIGAVFVRTPEHDVECEEFDYNVDTGIAILRAVPGRVVTVRSKSANTPIRAERVQWDMRSGKLRILGGEGGVAR